VGHYFLSNPRIYTYNVTQRDGFRKVKFNTFGGQDAEFCNVEAGVTCRNQCPSQGQERNGPEMCMPGTFNSSFILIFPSHALVSW